MIKEIIQSCIYYKGVFKHQLRAKDELLFIIHDIFISYVHEKATIAYQTYDSPTERLQLIIKEFVSVFDRYQPHISVFYQENIYLKPEYEILIKEKRDQFKQMVIDTLVEDRKSVV